jgi:DNA-binding NarL/FixJ family response regulator
MSMILVVDDDAAFASMLEVTLADAGYGCQTVASGELALSAVAHEQPAVVVLDIRLPGMSGYDVCRRLRELFGLTIGVVFISGERTEYYDQIAGLELGADDYLRKPFEPSELIARLRSLSRRLPSPAMPEPSARSQPERPLTRREREVLGLAAEGMAQKQIAQSLGIAPKTVGSHMGHVFEKLGVHSQAQAVAAARELQLPLVAAVRSKAEIAASATLLGLPVREMVEILAP